VLSQRRRDTLGYLILRHREATATHTGDGKDSVVSCKRSHCHSRWHMHE
jgi:hypothetical protein